MRFRPGRTPSPYCEGGRNLLRQVPEGVAPTGRQSWVMRSTMTPIEALLLEDQGVDLSQCP
jgi:hypothetical protein